MAPEVRLSSISSDSSLDTLADCSSIPDPFQAVMLLIDSSEHMRNGDFLPTRFEAQQDAITSIFHAKMNSNPENTVGVMTMGGAGGQGPQVLATPTADLGKILSAMHKASIGGESDISTGVQIAQLSLKHRQNKTQRQRLMIFVGSPLSLPSSSSSSSLPSDSDKEKALVKLGKKLKKNNIAVDVICFSADQDGDEAVLNKFVESVTSSDNSRIVVIPPGPHLLSEAIAASPILGGEDGGSGSGGMEDIASGGGGTFEFGVDPSMDPELAMVLRMSMEEEQARQAAANAASSSAAPVLETVPESAHPEVPETITHSSITTEAPAITSTSVSATGGEAVILPEEEHDEDAELAAALALSAGGEDVEMDGDDEDEDEEEAIRKAIEMSMMEAEEEEKGKK